jgi:hypothetical protein
MEANPALRYPLKKIESSDDYLQIQIIKYKPPGIGNQPGSFALNTSDQTYANVGIKDILKTIILPIPDNLQDSNSVSWGADTINPLQAAILTGANTLINGEGGLGGRVSSLMSKISKGAQNIKDLALTGTGQDYIVGAAAGLAAKTLIGSTGDVFESATRRTTGLVFNQNLELLFSGIAIRPEFSFAYDLIPRSKEEGQQIKQIIREFKTNSAASKGSAGDPGAGLFLKPPNVFKITYRSGNKDHPFLNRFKVCALLGISVDYAASGTYSTYPDATPTHMRMGLTFKELTPIYKEDYESGIGRDGVGY